MGARQSAERKRLAWRASGNQVNRADGTKIKIANVYLMHELRIEVRTQALARPLVDLDESAVLKPLQFKALRKASTPAEQLQTSHRMPTK